MNNNFRARSNKGAALLWFAIFAATLLNLSCGDVAKTPANSAAANQAAEKKLDEAEENLNSARRAGFTFIYRFRRPDEGTLTGEDKKYLKDNSPPETNQWLLTADGKVAVAGSNYKFMPGHLEALKKRFTVEDHSKPVEESVPDKNANAASRNANGAR